MSKRLLVKQPDDRPDIHLWEDEYDQVWACCAYDHGPMCFLCQKADATLVGLIENCAEGNMLARAKPDGGFEFKLTQKGTAAAENLIMGDPEMANMWAKLKAKRA